MLKIGISTENALNVLGALHLIHLMVSLGQLYPILVLNNESEPP